MLKTLLVPRAAGAGAGASAAGAGAASFFSSLGLAAVAALAFYNLRMPKK